MRAKMKLSLAAMVIECLSISFFFILLFSRRAYTVTNAFATMSFGKIIPLFHDNTQEKIEKKTKTTYYLKSVLLRTRMEVHNRKWKKERASDRIIFQPSHPSLMHFNSFAHGQRVLLFRSLAWDFSTPSVVLIYVFIVRMRFNLNGGLYISSNIYRLYTSTMLANSSNIIMCMWTMCLFFWFSVFTNLIWSILRKQFYL